MRIYYLVLELFLALLRRKLSMNLKQSSGTGGHHPKRISNLQKLTFKCVVKLEAGQCTQFC